jgi:hypothetical protein
VGVSNLDERVGSFSLNSFQNVGHLLRVCVVCMLYHY